MLLQALSWLLTVPGSSRTILDARIPYAQAALAQVLLTCCSTPPHRPDSRTAGWLRPFCLHLRYCYWHNLSRFQSLSRGGGRVGLGRSSSEVCESRVSDYTCSRSVPICRIARAFRHSHSGPWVHGCLGHRQGQSGRSQSTDTIPTGFPQEICVASVVVEPCFGIV